MTDPIVTRWVDAERILERVLDLPPDAQRAEARTLCGEDAELAAVVARLLDASRDDRLPAADGWMREALHDGTPAATSLPAMVGPFHVVAELGRGGMGRVLLGARAGLDGAPRVAIKLLDRHLDAHATRRRFDRERETLARLDHPHIARLYDGGVTADGAPYLVMEYVDGRPIDEYCRDQRLDIAARLALVRQVCAAVEFAHSRLVVHRDLKPANVMVDRHGQVKLLDFGIAKWIDELDAEASLTLTTHRVLTPSHAAPEQFRGEAITAATDVYQLGLLLYTLLTGQRAHAVDDPTPEATRRAACDIEPKRPSLMVAARDGDGAGRTLARRLAGDLDAIVLKALRKEPHERYATVEALRRDLDNHAHHRPVTARQGTGIYAMRKYVRRHPTAAAVLVALGAGIGAVLWQARVAAAERDRAVAAESASAAVNSFLVRELLAAPTPERAQGRPLAVAEVLANASRSVEFALKGAPRVQAEVRHTLARSYLALGQFDAAGAHAREAHDLLVAFAHGDDPALLGSRRLLVDIALAAGDVVSVKDEARTLLDDHRRVLGPTNPDTLMAHVAYGRVLLALDEVAAAEASLREANTAASTAREHAPEAWFAVRSALVDTLIDAGKAMAAESFVRDLITRLREHYGPTHPHLATASRQLALALTEQLEYEAAVTASEEQVRLHERLYGAEHPATARAIHELALAYDRATRDEQALATAVRAHELRMRVLGSDHPDTITSLRNVAISTRRSGRAADSLPMYRAVAESTARRFGPQHPRAIGALDDVGSPLLDLGRVNEARQVRRSAAAAYAQAASSSGDDDVLVSYANFLIDAEPVDLRDPAKAVALAERAVAATKRQRFAYVRTLARAYRAADRPGDALATAMEASALPAGIQSFVTETMVVDLLKTERPQAVETWLLERLARLRRERGPDEYLQVRTLEHLARHYLALGRAADAEARTREELDVLARSVPPTHFMVGSAQGDLGERLLDRGAAAEAEPLLVASFERHMTSRRFTSRGRERARDRMVRLYDALHRPTEARRYRDYVLPTFSDR